MSHEGYHEPYELLTETTRDLHRAIISLMEELEAIDWYQQRTDVCADPDLRAVLAHNRDEEIEHAMMTLEWIRRKSAKFDEDARTYLFTEGPIIAVEAAREAAGEGGGAPKDTAPKDTAPQDGSLGIGSLRARGSTP